jgi:CHAT domain-containing protein
MKAAAQMELRSGRMTTARALLDVARNTAASPTVAADVLTHIALVDVALRDTERAEVALRDAAAASNRIVDPDARRLARTHLEFASAALRVTSDPARAREMLTRAVDGYRTAGRLVFLPECFLLRARTESPQTAAEDLESGIAVLEQSPIRTGAVVGTGVLNAGVALYEDAIRLCAARNDVEGAFRYAERSRTQPDGIPIATVHELQQRLAGSGAAVLQVTELPEELVTTCVTERGATMQRQPLRRAADSLTPAELYDAVIRGFEPQLAHCHQLIVVAGGRLRDVPFAALVDAKAHRYLIEQMAVSTAMSASALRPAPPSRAGGSLLAVSLPSGNTNAGLPESAGEVGAVSALYPGARTIAPEAATFTAFEAAAPSARVIHIAGHTSQQSDEAGVALIFAQDRVTWRAIAQRRLSREPIVILAACNTLRQRFSANVRSQTLGDGFLAAGATDVVGTLTPIADGDARELFLSIHRHLAAGDVPAEAVRAAQREAIARHSDAWRAVASLTRCINGNEKRS